MKHLVAAASDQAYTVINNGRGFLKKFSRFARIFFWPLRGQPTANVHKCALRAVLPPYFQIPGYAPELWHRLSVTQSFWYQYRD